MEYESGIFQKLYGTPLGEDLWVFLNEAQSISKMEAACDLGKPAVEPISGDLLARFGEAIRENRIKQMIGHMVRQIMFDRGYIIHTQNSSVSSGGLFKKATTYIPLDKISDNKYRQGYVHGASELFRFLKGDFSGSKEEQVTEWINQLMRWQTEGLIQKNRDSGFPPRII